MRKMIQKLTTAIVTLALAFGSVVPSVAMAAGTTETEILTLQADKTQVAPGETVTLSLQLSENSDFVAGTFGISYDSSKVTYVAGSAKCGFKTGSSDVADTQFPGKIQLTYFIDGKVAGNPALTASFTVNDGVTGTLNFAVYNKEFAVDDVNDPSGKVITPTIINDTTGLVSKLPPTDITELTSKIAEAEAVDSSLYTAASYQNLEAAIAAAKEITTENTKDEVAAQVKALDDAIKQLVKAVDKTALKAVVDEAKTYDEALYTPDSYAALTKAVADAQSVLDADLADNAENQKTVADAAQAVKTAIAALSAKGDQAALAASIQAAEAALAREDVTYMDETKANVQTALNAAKALVGQENATDAEVSAAVKNLNDAVAKLVIAADENAFNAAVAQVREAFKEEVYTTSSWKAVAEALKNADAMAKRLAEGQVPAAEADKVLSDLQNATKGLMEKATKTEDLTKAVEAAKKLDESHYTADSFAVVKEALAAAEKVAGNLNDSTQQQVDTEMMNLNTAISKLVTIATDEKTGVTVNGLPAGEKIIVTDKMADKEALSEAQKAIDSASEFSDAKKADILFLADIKPEVIENADGTFTLTIPLTEKQMGYDLYYIGHKDEETGMFIWTAVTPKDNKLTLQVKSFSEFVVVGMMKPEEQNPGTNPSGDNKADTVNNATGTNASGNNANTGIVQDGNSSVAVAVGFLILAIAGLIAYRKRFNA